jgi:hypothetical protein
MRHKRLKLSALFLLGLGLTGLQAQTMHVKAKSGTKTAFFLPYIQKMTFGGGTVTVNKVEGSPEAFRMDTIQNISFDTLSPIFKIDASANPTNTFTIKGTGRYKWGSTVNLKAYAESGYKFVNWTENDVPVSTNASYYFKAYCARTLEANFVVARYAISASVEPANSGTITGAGEYTYDSTVCLTATPAVGYTFVNWTERNKPVSTDATYSFKAYYTKSVVANFVLNNYATSASVEPENSGTITGAGDYAHGSLATLTATPAVGYKFINWTENDTLVSSAATYSFTALGARTLVANFQSTSSALLLKDTGKTLKVYPNPVSHSLHVDLTGIEGMGTLSILTLEGKEMQMQNTPGERVPTLDLRSLPKGMYLCRYSSLTEIRTVKIIKH